MTVQITFSNIPINLDAMLEGNEGMFRSELTRACGVRQGDVADIRIMKKSVDARRKSDVHFVVTAILDIPSINDEAKLSKLKTRKGVNAMRHVEPEPLRIPDLSDMANSPGFKRPIIVGAGPAGMFCALYLSRAGLRPIVIERGKPVLSRMKDVSAFASGGRLNPDSNVQFGEGGAGTFSDGKLNTGIKSPHIRHVLEQFVDAGAPKDILVEAKPHIGTDELVDVVQNLRHEIEGSGGQFMFSTRLEEIELAGPLNSDASSLSDAPHIHAAKVRHLEEGLIESIPADIVILAIGHSARDTFAMLDSLGISMERKPFAAGVRVEHLQKDLDRSQYGKFAGHDALGAADYKLAAKTEDGRGVYSFCMCPGGQVVPAASEEGGVCVNGMSEHARDGRNGNSAILVEVKPDDLPGDDVLEGISFQRDLERAAYNLGARGDGPPYTAPAQTVQDFMDGTAGKPSTKVRPTYPRGVAWANLRECLPKFISASIAEGIDSFATKLDAFKDGQAVLTGVEARSSSPVRIVRNRDDLCSQSMQGLYPCGEGAGYAGGIMSAAVDGIKVAEAICANM